MSSRLGVISQKRIRDGQKEKGMEKNETHSVHTAENRGPNPNEARKREGRSGPSMQRCKGIVGKRVFAYITTPVALAKSQRNGRREVVGREKCKPMSAIKRVEGRNGMNPLTGRVAHREDRVPNHTGTGPGKRGKNERGEIQRGNWEGEPRSGRVWVDGAHLQYEQG